MKCLRNFLSVLLVLGVCVLIAPPAKAGMTITQNMCPTIISQPGEYDLATDIGPCATTDGIDITASEVTLHLNGYTITGTPNVGTCNNTLNNNVGVRVSSPVPGTMLSHVRVLGDGTIRNFFIGFLAENSNDSSVKFTTVTANCPFVSRGLVILGPANHWTLQGNVVREPGLKSQGILLRQIDDSHLVANDVNDTISLEDSSNNVIANNIADDTASGIFIGGISGITTGSKGSNGNEIHANTTNNKSSGNGLWIERGSTGNKVTGNYSFANLPFDMFDGNPGCGTNKWRGNHFGKANQPCIQSGKDDDSGEDHDRKDDDRG